MPGGAAMREGSVRWKTVLGNALYLVVVAILLLAIARYNDVLFHTTIEVFSMIVAAAVTIVAFNGRRLLDNDYLLLIGIAYLSFVILDVPHMLAFPGINIFGENGLDYAAQLYVAQRLILATSFVIAPAFLRYRLRPYLALFIYLALTSLALYSIFGARVFPTAYLPETGLTSFKVGSQVLITVMFTASLLALAVNRASFDRTVLWLLLASNVAFIVSEVLLSLYTDQHDPLLLVGHLAQGMAFYLTYKAVVETALVRPSTLLYKSLADRERALSVSERRYREVAETLQTALLQLPEDVPGVSLVHRYQSSSDTARIGGDFYDVFEAGTDSVAFALGDVSGKGLPAATTTAEVKSTLRAYAYLEPNPRFVLEHTNTVLRRLLGESQFVTAVFGVLNLTDGRLEIASAGHEEPVLCLRESCQFLELPTNIPLGIEGHALYESIVLDLRPGEGIITYTDGIPDARRGQDMFGRERIRQLVAGMDPKEPGKVVERIVEETLAFTGGVLSDDIAVLGVQLTPDSSSG
ncbi:MAG TPA: MASE3 domain-containing protein [Coriobacteriia bacterium]|nr:MASE3 domain-containing protein [Coriobacteriia bacterium]